MWSRFGARRWTLPTVAVLTVGGLALAGTAPAYAHNVLVDSSPEDGDTLDSVPEEVELVFNEEVLEAGDGNSIVVTGPDGSTFEDGELQIDHETVQTDLRPLEESGDYTIDFRIVSADGHPIQESLTFTLSDEAVKPEESETAEEPAEEEAETQPAESEEVEEVTGGGIPPWLAVVVAIAVVGIVVSILIRFMSSRGKNQGPGPTA